MLLKCAFHTVLGVVMFMVVGGAAYVLQIASDWIAEHHVSPYITYPMRGLEFFLFAVDFILFVLFFIREAWLFINALRLGELRHVEQEN